MSEISKDEAISEFLEFSKNKFSAIRFSADGSTFRFKPAMSVGFLSIVFYLITLVVPHAIYWVAGYSKNAFYNNVIYGCLTFLGIVFFALFVLFLPVFEVLIDRVSNEVDLIPKDVIGRYFKRSKQFKISEIADIKLVQYKSKSRTEVYFSLVLKNGWTQRLFAMSNWENTTKLRAAFLALLYDKPVFYDDSCEPSVQFDKKLEKLKNERDGETSYLPLIALSIALLVIVVGFIVYLALGKTPYFCAEVDSLYPVVFKYCAISIGPYAILLFFASRTTYQKRSKSSLKTFIVLGLMAIGGFYMLCAGLVRFCNIKMDHSQPIRASATVMDSYYQAGSRNSSGYYVIVVQLEGSTKKISVRHNNIIMHRDLRRQVTVSVFEGYFKKRWLRVESDPVAIPE